MIRNTTLVLFIVLIIQIIYGAFVAGLKAGMFYPTWPKMGTEWFPEDTILVEDSFIKNFFEIGAGVQFMHRTIAFLIVGCVAVLWNKSTKINLTKQQNIGVSFLIYGVASKRLKKVSALLKKG